MEQQPNLQLCLDLLPDAAWAIDTRGTVTAWNRAIEEMTGVASEAIIGKNNYEYALPFYGERRPVLIDVAVTPDSGVEKRYLSFTRTGDTVAADEFVPYVRAGGAFLRCRARRILGPAGHTAGAIQTVHDVTEYKKPLGLKSPSEAIPGVSGEAGSMSHEMHNSLAAVLQNMQNIQRRISSPLEANFREAERIGLNFDTMQTYLAGRGIFDMFDIVFEAGARTADLLTRMTTLRKEGQSHND